MSSPAEPRFDIQKLASVRRATVKTKLFSEKVIPSQITVEKLFKFSWVRVKFDVNVSANPKTTFENKQALAAVCRERNYYLKSAMVRKIKSKMCFYTFDF